MVVGVLIDGQGQPISCELWPGNTTDVKTLLPIVEKDSARIDEEKITSDFSLPLTRD